MTALVATYVALALLVAGLYSYGRGALWLKTLVAGGAGILYIAHYLALVGLSGWPAWEQPPMRFRLVAAQIYEPNPLLGGGGHIYLWATSLDDNAGFTTPRAYTLDYNEALHRHLNDALRRLNNGAPQMGELRSEGVTVGEARGEQTEIEDSSILFHNLPQRLLPDK